MDLKNNVFSKAICLKLYQTFNIRGILDGTTVHYFISYIDQLLSILIYIDNYNINIGKNLNFIQFSKHEYTLFNKKNEFICI